MMYELILNADKECQFDKLQTIDYPRIAETESAWNSISKIRMRPG